MQVANCKLTVAPKLTRNWQHAPNCAKLHCASCRLQFVSCQLPVVQVALDLVALGAVTFDASCQLPVASGSSCFRYKLPGVQFTLGVQDSLGASCLRCQLLYVLSYWQRSLSSKSCLGCQFLYLLSYGKLPFSTSHLLAPYTICCMKATDTQSTQCNFLYKTTQ